MELLHVWIPGRDPSLADVVFNTVGAAAGAIAAIVLRPWLQGVAKRRNPQSSAAILLLGCWIAYQLFPFLPELRPYRLYHEYRTLLHTQSISVVAVWANAAEWMAAAVALQAIVPRSSARWAPAVIGLLAMRVFTPERTVSAEEISGAAAFLLLWFAIRERLRRGAALWMMISSVTLRELEPFRWAAAPAGFSWVPFRASFLSDIQSGVTMVLRKAFDYGGVVWLLVQARVRYRWAAAMTAAALLALELVQRYLPGRTPEITDAALAAIMAVALWTAART
jgi:VanZ family protein